MKYLVNVEENLKHIKDYTKFLECYERFLNDIKNRDCEQLLPHISDISYLKNKKDILMKQLMCDHKNTYEEIWTNGHNGDETNVTICRDCNFIIEKN